jgi:hypothetical protein
MMYVEALARLLETAYGLSDVRCRLIKGTLHNTYRITSTCGSYILHPARLVRGVASC